MDAAKRNAPPIAAPDHGGVSGRAAAHLAGRQRHRLRREGESFRIVQKRVDLINCDAAFEALAVPI